VIFITRIGISVQYFAPNLRIIMSATISPATRRSYLASTLQCRCARCREGRMFRHSVHFFSLKKNMAMYEHCPVCGQPMEIEVGFYYGTGYVSYALTVAISVASFVAWWVLLGFSINDNSLYYWIATNIALLVLLLPWIMRLSRSIWLSFFVKYDPDWRTKPAYGTERILKEHMERW
jgi:uncharacterized protein (DUF983 family)